MSRDVGKLRRDFVGEVSVSTLRELIRTIPDYPKPGIMFRDVTTLLGDAQGLKAAVAYVNRIGLDAIEARDLALTRRLREGLKEIRRVRLVSPESAELCASVTNFRVEGMTPADLQDRLWDKRLRVRHMGDGVRCGTHFYCAEEEIERLLARMRDIAS